MIAALFGFLAVGFALGIGTAGIILDGGRS